MSGFYKTFINGTNSGAIISFNFYYNLIKVEWFLILLALEK
jgi:hypothetical protein